jgi:hypothetical protein
MHTVVETPEFLRAAKRAGMTDVEREAALLFLSEHPQAGEVIEGSGRARKLRIAREGKGKRGG